MAAPAGRDAREQVRLAAEWVLDFAAPCYGPGGAAKLVDAGDAAPPSWLRSGASALREAPVRHPLVGPYVRLASDVQGHAGDQATGALLLAASLVRRGCEAMREGARPAGVVQGLRLARRQALAALGAAAQPGRAPLGAVHPAEPEAAGLVLAGLRRLGESGGNGSVDLDSIEVRAEPGGRWEWLDGVVLDAPQGAPRRAGKKAGTLLVLEGGWQVRPRAEGASYRLHLRNAGGAAGAEDALRNEAVADLARRGVAFLAAGGAVDEGLRARAESRGIVVWQNVARSARQRLAAATGATPSPRLADAAPGACEAERRNGSQREDTKGGCHWIVRGRGPSWTLAAPAQNASGQAAARDAAERLLRAAGAVLRDPRAVPGGGRWQRSCARALRSAHASVPGGAGGGHAPLGVLAAAQAFDDLADALLRNAGRDPMAGGVLGEVEDAHACVRLAVTAAFDLALQALRIDGIHAKAASSAQSLRGGGGRRPGSASGLPGDTPPLM